jgi:hypothetical protein
MVGHLKHPHLLDNSIGLYKAGDIAEVPGETHCSWDMYRVVIGCLRANIKHALASTTSNRKQRTVTSADRK